MQELEAHRLAASRASGGTSSRAIRDLVMALLGRHAPTGSLLDFGAGRGDLLGDLARTGRYAQLVGADLYPPPPELGSEVEWLVADLNLPLPWEERFDVVVCSEVIEHLENPRQTMRTLFAALRPGGVLVLTMPNQESLRSLVSLLVRRHFVQFLDGSYPAHITALLELDLVRICREVGFEPPKTCYTDHGSIPRLTRLTWQQVSLGALGGRAFSDNVAIVTRRPGGTRPDAA